MTQLDYDWLIHYLVHEQCIIIWCWLDALWLSTRKQLTEHDILFANYFIPLVLCYSIPSGWTDLQLSVSCKELSTLQDECISVCYSSCHLIPWYNGQHLCILGSDCRQEAQNTLQPLHIVSSCLRPAARIDICMFRQCGYSTTF